MKTIYKTTKKAIFAFLLKILNLLNDILEYTRSIYLAIIIKVFEVNYNYNIKIISNMTDPQKAL
jgi:hypothetical protein